MCDPKMYNKEALRDGIPPPSNCNHNCNRNSEINLIRSLTLRDPEHHQNVISSCQSHTSNPAKKSSKSVNDICRATLCVSAVFAVARCLSLSVCHVDALYPHGFSKISSNFFVDPVAPSF